MFATADHKQNAELNPHFSTMPSEATKADARDHLVDPRLYYPTAISYGYYGSGNESTGELDGQQRVYGMDGTDMHYTVAQTESLPYVYYTPNYGYGETSYNPYNPYIPDALIGHDGTYLGTQSYYTLSPYQNSPSSSQYPSNAIKGIDGGGKQKLPSSFKTFPQNHSKPASNQRHPVPRMLDGSRVNSGTSKLPLGHQLSASGCASISHGSSSPGPQGGNASFSRRVTDNISHGKIPSQHNHFKVSVPVSGGFSGFSSSSNGRIQRDDSWHNFYYRSPFSDGTRSPDFLGEQNRGPITEKSKNQFVVKAYTTKAGQVDSQGNIVISADQYNKDDFPVDYVDAKFFVIKSYSEDDVHKSVKYNIWSSTPNGNKKLNSAYEDAQRIAAGKSGACPIFLYFSVNASGQYCGVAEMAGPVDFLNDMDFWQQDKWSGSFPVKWHIIKDTPNSNFRHIILENNEYKPVTNSRDTQEIMYGQGIEMLKIFKSYVPKTSLLDDFLYYEHRQRIMHDERARLSRINAHSSVSSGKYRPLVDPPVDMGKNIAGASSSSEKMMAPATQYYSPNNTSHRSFSAVSKGRKYNGGSVSDLNIGSLTINSERADHNTSGGLYGTVTKVDGRVENSGGGGGGKNGGVSDLDISALAIDPELAVKNSEQVNHKRALMSSASLTGSVPPVDTVTVGSMPVKVNEFANPSGLLTVGSIPLDASTLQVKDTGLLSNENSREK
ncbi:YTH domain-containing protein [Drosera capensis]